MSAREKSEATIEKFNNKVIKFLTKLGAKKVENPNIFCQYTIDTLAGPLEISLHEPQASVLFSIFARFTNIEKANEVRIADALPHVSQLNQYSGKWNFHSSNEKRAWEDFTSAIERIYLKSIDVTYTIRIKEEKNPPEFLAGLGKGVVEKRLITLKVQEQDMESPSLQAGIYEIAQQLMNEFFEVTIEKGDTISKLKIKKN